MYEFLYRSLWGFFSGGFVFISFLLLSSGHIFIASLSLIIAMFCFNESINK